MIAVDEGAQEDIELTMISSESASTTMSGDREQYPSESDIQAAIEKGDWSAVGATAAILASSDSTGVTSVEMDDNATKDSSESNLGAASVGSHTDEDDARAAELAELVESGNWDVSIATDLRIQYSAHRQTQQKI